MNKIFFRSSQDLENVFVEFLSVTEKNVKEYMSVRTDIGMSILNFNSMLEKNMFPEGTEICFERTEKVEDVIAKEKREAMFLYKNIKIYFYLERSFNFWYNFQIEYINDIIKSFSVDLSRSSESE